MLWCIHTRAFTRNKHSTTLHCKHMHLTVYRTVVQPLSARWIIFEVSTESKSYCLLPIGTDNGLISTSCLSPCFLANIYITFDLISKIRLKNVSRRRTIILWVESINTLSANLLAKVRPLDEHSQTNSLWSSSIIETENSHLSFSYRKNVHNESECVLFMTLHNQHFPLF